MKAFSDWNSLEKKEDCDATPRCRKGFEITQRAAKLKLNQTMTEW